MKNKECQMSIKKETDYTRELSDIMDKDESVDKLTKYFLKHLDGFVHKNFKKIKVTEQIDKELEEMYSKKAELKTKLDPERKKSFYKK